MKTKRNLWAVLALLVVLALAVEPVAAAPAHSYGYVVKLGDTLASISRKFGVSADRIMDLNHLRTRPDIVIYVGETLTIPVDLGYTPSYTGPFLYVVQTGDTVQLLNNKFATDKFTLRQVNGLASDANVLTPGTTLFIPAGPHRYNVKTGDTIQSIAAMFATTSNYILRFNAHLGNGATLAPGQEVFIPIIYNVGLSPITSGASTTGGLPEGSGGGGLVPPSNSNGLKPTDSAVAAQAANANVTSAFQTITMPQNVVNLNGDLTIRWAQFRRARRDPSRDNGAIMTVAIEFRGGTGTVSIQQYVTTNGVLSTKGLQVTGIYVNPSGGELWNDIEVEVPGTCSASNKAALVFTSGVQQVVSIDMWADCP